MIIGIPFNVPTGTDLSSLIQSGDIEMTYQNNKLDIWADEDEDPCVCFELDINDDKEFESYDLEIKCPYNNLNYVIYF